MTIRTLILAGIAGAALLPATSAIAQTPAYIGEVQLYAGTYCPKGLSDTQGQVLPIAQNQALFSLLGVVYGGNGVTTFALPDLRGRSAYSQGTGPGLPTYTQGQTGGTENTTLNVGQMPAHMHMGYLRAVGGSPNIDDPTNAALADFPAGFPIYANNTTATVNMKAGSVQSNPTGGSQPYQNLGPYLTMRFCIAKVGVFPSRQ